MIGWSGAISTIVRAIASAVSGSLDGVLMIASERAIALRTMLNAAISGLLPAMMCTARAPNARTDAVRPSDIVRGTQPSRYAIPIVLSATSRTDSGENSAGSCSNDERTSGAVMSE